MLKVLWRPVLIASLTVALVAPARAESLATAEKQLIAGIVVVSAAIAVTVTLLIVHHKRQSSVTGCVIAGANGMSLADERDQRMYALSGNTAAVKAGNRVMLQGKRQKQGNGTFIFEAQRVSQDLGACQP